MARFEGSKGRNNSSRGNFRENSGRKRSRNDRFKSDSRNKPFAQDNSRDRRNRSGQDSRSKRPPREPVYRNPKNMTKEEKWGGRESKRNSRNRRDFKMTVVTCSACGERCSVPFVPKSDKPIYCENCMPKKGNNETNSEVTLDKINRKLDQILRILEEK